MELLFGLLVTVLADFIAETCVDLVEGGELGADFLLQNFEPVQLDLGARRVGSGQQFCGFYDSGSFSARDCFDRS